MSTATHHLISPKIPGYGLSDGRCLPCSGISGARAFNISPCSSRGDYKSLPKYKILPLRCVSRGGALSVCHAYSSGQERNNDFSRDKQPYFRNRKNRQNEESDDIDNEEDDILPSKNGPLLSGSAKRSTTETPGAKEREIVEIFKKVQEKLRQRAAQKDEKKVEESQVESKQTETVDSLVNLLRQHSAQQGKQSKYNGTSSDINSDQRKENDPVLGGKLIRDPPNLKGKTKTSSGSSNRVKNLAIELLDQPDQDRNGDHVWDFLGSKEAVKPAAQKTDQARPINDDHVWTFLGSKEAVKPAAQKTEGISVKRPVSNFQRRSPVPQVRYDPVDSRVEKNVSFAPFTNTNGKKKKKKKVVFEPKPNAKPEPEPEPELETELFLDDDDGSVGKLLDEEISEKDEIVSHDMDDDEDEEEEEDDDDDEHVDLSRMKLAELRALAKSRGMKGYTKLKKQELVELLAGGSI